MVACWSTLTLLVVAYELKWGDFEIVNRLVHGWYKMPEVLAKWPPKTEGLQKCVPQTASLRSPPRQQSRTKKHYK